MNSASVAIAPGSGTASGLLTSTRSPEVSAMPRLRFAA